jgi:hypothetical protein
MNRRRRFANILGGWPECRSATGPCNRILELDSFREDSRPKRKTNRMTTSKKKTKIAIAPTTKARVAKRRGRVAPPRTKPVPRRSPPRPRAAAPNEQDPRPAETARWCYFKGTRDGDRLEAKLGPRLPERYHPKEIGDARRVLQDERRRSVLPSALQVAVLIAAEPPRSAAFPSSSPLSPRRETSPPSLNSAFGVCSTHRAMRLPNHRSASPVLPAREGEDISFPSAFAVSDYSLVHAFLPLLVPKCKSGDPLELRARGII